jgi:hypothetical protein
MHKSNGSVSCNELDEYVNGAASGVILVRLGEEQVWYVTLPRTYSIVLRRVPHGNNTPRSNIVAALTDGEQRVEIAIFGDGGDVTNADVNSGGGVGGGGGGVKKTDVDVSG